MNDKDSRAKRGRAARRKGHDFEREIANKLSTIYPGAARGLQYQHGLHCPDVVGTPYHIECKHLGSRSFRPLDALEQASSDAKLASSVPGVPLRPPVAICKMTGVGTVVCMYLHDWLALVNEADGGDGA